MSKQSLFFSVKMAHLRAYFKRKPVRFEGPVTKKKPQKKSRNNYPPCENVNRAEIEIVIDEVEKLTARKNYYNIIPKHDWIKVGRYTLDHSTKDALEKFSKQFPKFTLKSTSINSWKTLLKMSGDNQTFNKKIRPNLLSETLFKKTKDAIVGSRLAGTVIYWRMVIDIGTGVAKTNVIQVKLLHLWD